ncbi:hypothetical protein POVWA2_024730 [Plasmodium ovale wallikeri]|uniref:Uncharacterized protein n=1 Tax=Plasmodium ovale wallikeri TaxID=864142 RepID=A0A1A8YV02_PLAOA|nr:hypothetical protein POVWA1_024880 [Plasmodium ovale wallikeri]SBT35378.1 hypothetical protein POVWA2_024730 [Plasmodium ovale wallikeri]
MYAANKVNCKCVKEKPYSGIKRRNGATSQCCNFYLILCFKNERWGIGKCCFRADTCTCKRLQLVMHLICRQLHNSWNAEIGLFCNRVLFQLCHGVVAQKASPWCCSVQSFELELNYL